MLSVLRSAALLVALGFVSIEAGAVPIAYEGFAYTPSPLPGKGGGFGFGGVWAGDLGVLVQPGPGLQHVLALPSSGRMIGGGFDSNRSLAAAIASPTFWASFLIRSDPGNDQVWLGFDVAATSLPVIAFGRRLDSYFIQNGANPAVSFGPASPPGVTDLLIARVIRGGATTTVDLWVNKPTNLPPDLTSVFGGTPAPTVVDTQVQPGLFADEIRIGTAPGDVAAAEVPLPTWALWLVGALLPLLARTVSRSANRQGAGRTPRRDLAT